MLSISGRISRNCLQPFKSYGTRAKRDKLSRQMLTAAENVRTSACNRSNRVEHPRSEISHHGNAADERNKEHSCTNRWSRERMNSVQRLIASALGLMIAGGATREGSH